MTVREMFDRMGSDELSEWIAFGNVTGDLDPHFGLAQIARELALANGVRRPRLHDYYPVPPPKPKPSQRELKAKLDALAFRHNSNVNT